MKVDRIETSVAQPLPAKNKVPFTFKEKNANKHRESIKSALRNIERGLHCRDGGIIHHKCYKNSKKTGVLE